MPPVLPPETRADWSRRVRERRKLLGLTQERLEELSGVAQSTISKVESGDPSVRISDDLKWRLAGGLCCTVADLFPWPSVRPPISADTQAVAS
jgi:transcriptional regulator with XRE-family HTH domain